MHLRSCAAVIVGIACRAIANTCCLFLCRQSFLDDIKHQLRTNPDFKGILTG